MILFVFIDKQVDGVYLHRNQQHKHYDTTYSRNHKIIIYRLNYKVNTCEVTTIKLIPKIIIYQLKYYEEVNTCELTTIKLILGIIKILPNYYTTNNRYITKEGENSLRCNLSQGS